MSAHGYHDEGVSAADLPVDHLSGHPHHDDGQVDKMDSSGEQHHHHHHHHQAALDKQDLLGLQLLSGHQIPQVLEASLSGDHGLVQMRGDAFVTEEGTEGLGKRGLVDEVLGSSLSGSYAVDLGGEVAPSKKRKMFGEAQQKRQKYDILKAFFKVYFKEDPSAMVPKDAMYILYTRKIPLDARIARNAMYRHMWSHFKDKIQSFQSNYREYVKGIKLVTSWPQPSFEGIDKDVELLQSLGVGELYDFDEEELSKDGKDSKQAAITTSNSFGSVHTGSPSQYIAEDNAADAQLMNFIEGLENTAKNLLQQLKDIKAKLRKKAANAQLAASNPGGW